MIFKEENSKLFEIFMHFVLNFSVSWWNLIMMTPNVLIILTNIFKEENPELFEIFIGQNIHRIYPVSWWIKMTPNYSQCFDYFKCLSVALFLLSDIWTTKWPNVKGGFLVPTLKFHHLALFKKILLL